MQLYDELANWFHLLTHPDEYAEEAAHYLALIRRFGPGARSLLELGSGGGNNASHLKRDLCCTLSDVSPRMLALSEALNPECEHIRGDMRTLRLDRTFDAVLVHDAVMYLTTEDDLRAAMETAYVHTRPGGVALFVPDCTFETFVDDAVETGGHDGVDGRRLRYLEWSHDPDPADTTFEVDFAVLLHEPGRPPRVVHDHHVCGIFSEDVWLTLLDGVGFVPTVEQSEEPGAPQPIFLARR
jgi:SAM-dependent methyltransferase